MEGEDKDEARVCPFLEFHSSHSLRANFSFKLRYIATTRGDLFIEGRTQ